MNDAAPSLSAPPSRLFSRPFSGAWLNVVIAALAMVATLPGRTIGLAIFTEPIIAALHLGARQYAAMNLWATLIGSTFALLCGPLIDRFGTRIVLSITLALLGATVLVLSRVITSAGFATVLTFTRGFGQSALSAVSIALVGKSFSRRLNIAMAAYAAMVAFGFCLAFPVVQFSMAHHGWRFTLGEVGLAIFGLAIIAAICVRSWIDGGLSNPSPARADAAPKSPDGNTLREAIRIPAFWTFALGAAMFTLVFSGVSLFSEAILRERQMAGQLTTALGILTLAGLIANFLGGWLLEKWPLERLMGLGLIFTAAGLFLLARAATPMLVALFAITLGAAGGVVTVVFFACWPRMFGRRHLGKIQGAAQAMTVLASAAGPWVLAVGESRSGSYAPLFFIIAPGMAILGIIAFAVPAPTNHQR